MGKSLQQIAYDTIEAHQETIADLRTQLAKSNERESVLSCQLDSHMERVAELEKENKRESMELRSRLGAALSRNSEYNEAIENMQQKLAKANERVKELEKDILRQSVFMEKTSEKLEQHREWQATANVLRRPTREAKQALDKFAIDKKIEALEFILRRVEPVTVSHAVKDHIVYYIKQLRKEQE